MVKMSNHGFGDSTISRLSAVGSDLAAGISVIRTLNNIEL